MSYDSIGSFLYEQDSKEHLDKSNTYEEILDKTRDFISQNHSDELAAVIADVDSGLTVRRLIGKYIADHECHLPNKTMTQLVDMVYSDMVGFGFLEEYIHNPNIEEINGNSWRDIEIVMSGGWKKLKVHFSSPQRAVDMIRKMARLGGLILDNATPIIDSYLTKGIRLSAAIPPVVDMDTGVVFSLRRQRMAKTTAQDLLDWETASKNELELMRLLVNHGISLGLAGATSSGKTTDLSYILNSLDLSKRIYTIEETRELDLTREDEDNNVISRVVHLCTRQSTSEKLTIDSNLLLRHALRFHPDVIVAAEMRGAEAMTAQEAARTGHAVVTTLHANTARAAYFRILSMCRMSGTELEDRTLMQFIVEAFPVMVFKKQLPDGTRKVMEIVEAVGLAEDGQVIANTLFHYNLETGEHEQGCDISPELAQRLLDDGADKKLIRQFYRGPFYKSGKGAECAC